MISRWTRLAGAALTTLMVVAGAVPVHAQSSSAPSAAPPATPPPSSPDKPTEPFAPGWGMVAGWDVFAKKDCGKCHAVRGAGGTTGPDLARVKNESFFEIGAAIWNHLPKMGERMREMRIERARLTPRDASNLIAFIFTAQYTDQAGDASNGEKLFQSKGCVTCHAVGGKGGNVGPALDTIKRANSPVIVAAAMWNHGPKMVEAMKAKGIMRPTLEGKELLDIIAYVQSVAKDTGETAQVVPGTPERGRKLFAEKKCAECHAVGSMGAKVGPDLGKPGHQGSLTEFAARMWTHEPAMAARMKQRGLAMPTLNGQEMADILAYLYVSRYFEQPGSAERGKQLLQDKGCLGCHGAKGKSETPAADFARSTVVRTAPGLVAGLWNHSRLMEHATQKSNVTWPTLTGQELADMSTYLASLSAAPAKGKPAKEKRAPK
jgi:mono/diheme cytochrome c family protein